MTNINLFKPKTMTYLALNMRWKRKSLGWTQEELAERLGVGRSV
ncbi:MAG: helix-turn-helix transcriptional regulator, partial [Sphingomonadales bacterium]|nr:helix-turn-helix transcriptional regulator [Sphingomonadales bacterium]